MQARIESRSLATCWDRVIVLFTKNQTMPATAGAHVQQSRILYLSFMPENAGPKQEVGPGA